MAEVEKPILGSPSLEKNPTITNYLYPLLQQNLVGTHLV